MFLNKMKNVNSVGAYQGHFICVQVFAALSYPMDHPPPDYSVHRILQGRVLECIAMPSSRCEPSDQGIEMVSLMSPTLADELGIPLYLFVSISFYHQSISNNKS